MFAALDGEVAVVACLHHSGYGEAVIYVAIGQWYADVVRVIKFRYVHAVQALAMPVLRVLRECGHALLHRLFGNVVVPENIAEIRVCVNKGAVCKLEQVQGGPTVVGNGVLVHLDR